MELNVSVTNDRVHYLSACSPRFINSRNGFSMIDSNSIFFVSKKSIFGFIETIWLVDRNAGTSLYILVPCSYDRGKSFCMCFTNSSRRFSSESHLMPRTFCCPNNMLVPDLFGHFRSTWNTQLIVLICCMIQIFLLYYEIYFTDAFRPYTDSTQTSKKTKTSNEIIVQMLHYRRENSKLSKTFNGWIKCAEYF